MGGWIGGCITSSARVCRWVGEWMGGCITSSAASSLKSLGVEVALYFFVLERLIPIVECGFQKLASVIQDLRGDHLWQWCERTYITKRQPSKTQTCLTSADPVHVDAENAARKRAQDGSGRQNKFEFLVI